jgi:hypothetical protein
MWPYLALAVLYVPDSLDSGTQRALKRFFLSKIDHEPVRMSAGPAYVPAVLPTIDSDGVFPKGFHLQTLVIYKLNFHRITTHLL